MSRGWRAGSVALSVAIAGCAVTIDGQRLAPPPERRALSESAVAPAGYARLDARLPIAGVGGVQAALFRREGAKGLIVYAGGRGYRMERASRRVGRLAALSGANILVFDYPGRGASDGVSDAASLQALARGLTAAARAEGWIGDLPIVVYGFSFGGVVAALIAAEEPVAGIVVEASADAPSAVAHNLLPPIVRPFLHVQVKPSDIAYRETLAAAGAPILLMAGGGDELVPPHLVAEFAEALRGDGATVQFLAVQGAAHGDALYLAEGGDAARRFFRSAFSRSTPSQN